MKQLLTILSISLLTIGFAQDKEISTDSLPGLDKLENVVIVGQLDDKQDLFALEINLTQLFSENGVKTKSSLNIVKQGATGKSLANDSVQKVLKTKGFDTYMLISVRGYDRRFRPSTKVLEFNDALLSEHLFPIYRDDIVSVTFEITFYRDGKPLENRLIKVGTVGSEESVMKKLNKKLAKLIKKEW